MNQWVEGGGRGGTPQSIQNPNLSLPFIFFQAVNAYESSFVCQYTASLTTGHHTLREKVLRKVMTRFAKKMRRICPDSSIR